MVGDRAWARILKHGPVVWGENLENNPPSHEAGGKALMGRKDLNINIMGNRELPIGLCVSSLWLKS